MSLIQLVGLLFLGMTLLTLFVGIPLVLSGKNGTKEFYKRLGYAFSELIKMPFKKA